MSANGMVRPCCSPTSERRGPQVGPSLTAAARDGRIIVRAGTEEWLRRGPNKRMAPNRRAKCRQTRYPDPKPLTVHQTGASPMTVWRWRHDRAPLPKRVIEALPELIQERVAEAHLAQTEFGYFLREPRKPPRKLSGCCAGRARRVKKWPVTDEELDAAFGV